MPRYNFFGKLGQSVPGGDVLIEIDLQKGADGIIAVAGKAMPVPGQNQEQVQEDLLSIQRGQKTVGQKAVGDEAEPARDLPDPVRIENPFGQHGMPSL